MIKKHFIFIVVKTLLFLLLLVGVNADSLKIENHNDGSFSFTMNSNNMNMNMNKKYVFTTDSKRGGKSLKAIEKMKSIITVAETYTSLITTNKTSEKTYEEMTCFYQHLYDKDVLGIFYSDLVEVQYHYIYRYIILLIKIK